MADIEEGMSSYYFCVRSGPYCFNVGMEEPVKPKPRDILRFDVTVSVRHCENYFGRRRFMRASTLLETSISMSCESLLENNKDFLQSFLSNSRISGYVVPESLDQITHRIVFRVGELLKGQNFSFDPEFVDSECREFPLALGIVVEVMEESQEEYEEMERVVIEESMQEGVTMIPSSNEAIHSLKTFTDSLFLETENCNICMDKFRNESILLSSMPCGHVFHHQCIVKWLQTSHTCPLCRYPMPTTEG